MNSDKAKCARERRFIRKSVIHTTLGDALGERHYYHRLFLYLFIPLVILAAVLNFGKC